MLNYINSTNDYGMLPHFENYHEMLSKNNNKLVSKYLTDQEIKKLYNKKYNLNEFDIYKYITAYDYLNDSLGCNKIKLTEGIILNKNKYSNILVDLFFNDIPADIFINWPISMVFGIKKVNGEISDFTKSEIKILRSSHEIMDDLDYPPYYNDEIIVEVEEKPRLIPKIEDLPTNFYDMYKSEFDNYAGNSKTYKIFKELVILILGKVSLYKFKGELLTFKQLESLYNASLYDGGLEYQGELNQDWDHKTTMAYYNGTLNLEDIKYKDKDPDPIPEAIPMSQLIIDNKIEEFHYQCVKVTDPKDLDFGNIMDLNIYLADISKIVDAEDLNSLVKKSINEFFWGAHDTSEEE